MSERGTSAVEGCCYSRSARRGGCGTQYIFTFLQRPHLSGMAMQRVNTVFPTKTQGRGVGWRPTAHDLISSWRNTKRCAAALSVGCPRGTRENRYARGVAVRGIFTGSLIYVVVTVFSSFRSVFPISLLGIIAISGSFASILPRNYRGLFLT